MYTVCITVCITVCVYVHVCNLCMYIIMQKITYMHIRTYCNTICMYVHTHI